MTRALELRMRKHGPALMATTAMRVRAPRTFGQSLSLAPGGLRRVELFLNRRSA